MFVFVWFMCDIHNHCFIRNIICLDQMVMGKTTPLNRLGESWSIIIDNSVHEVRGMVEGNTVDFLFPYPAISQVTQKMPL